MPNLVMFKNAIVQSMSGRSYKFTATVPLHVAPDDVDLALSRGAMTEEDAAAISRQIKGEVPAEEPVEQPTEEAAPTTSRRSRS